MGSSVEDERGLSVVRYLSRSVTKTWHELADRFLLPESAHDDCKGSSCSSWSSRYLRTNVDLMDTFLSLLLPSNPLRDVLLTVLLCRPLGLQNFQSESPFAVHVKLILTFLTRQENGEARTQRRLQGRDSPFCTDLDRVQHLVRLIENPAFSMAYIAFKKDRSVSVENLQKAFQFGAGLFIEVFASIFETGEGDRLSTFQGLGLKPLHDPKNLRNQVPSDRGQEVEERAEGDGWREQTLAWIESGLPKPALKTLKTLFMAFYVRFDSMYLDKVEKFCRYFLMARFPRIQPHLSDPGHEAGHGAREGKEPGTVADDGRGRDRLPLQNVPGSPLSPGEIEVTSCVAQIVNANVFLFHFCLQGCWRQPWKVNYNREWLAAKGDQFTWTLRLCKKFPVLAYVLPLFLSYRQFTSSCKYIDTASVCGWNSLYLFATEVMDRPETVMAQMKAGFSDPATAKRFELQFIASMRTVFSPDSQGSGKYSMSMNREVWTNALDEYVSAWCPSFYLRILRTAFTRAPLETDELFRDTHPFCGLSDDVLNVVFGYLLPHEQGVLVREATLLHKQMVPNETDKPVVSPSNQR